MEYLHTAARPMETPHSRPLVARRPGMGAAGIEYIATATAAVMTWSLMEL
jgi:hypothetical protein